MLKNAITDVGYWRWWTEKLPDSFQLEFGGVQLYQKPSDDSQPSSGLCALRFRYPSFVRCLEFEHGIHGEWFSQLHRDESKPLNLDSESFHFNDEKAVNTLVSKAVRVTDFFLAPKASESTKSRFVFAFRSGEMGMHIEAESMHVLNLSGEIPLDSISQLHGDWWEYWKKYWRFRDTSEAMPKDYACEVTIPAGE